MREAVRNTRWACHCGRFVRTSSVEPTQYVCTRCGRQQGRAREVVVGHGVTMVDVLMVVPGRGRVPITDGQEELDLPTHRMVGAPCAPLNCPDCGQFSSESWDTGERPSDSGTWREWGGRCKVHGHWCDSL